MAEQSRNWIVVGSSPSATEMLPVARERWPDATTITTNAGIYLFGQGDRPTYYLVWDHAAAERYKAATIEAQRAGVKLITADRLWHDPVRCPHTEHYDIRLTLPDNKVAMQCVLPDSPRCPYTEHYDIRLTLPDSETALRYVRGAYLNPAYSGLLATQFALNNGAEAVAWVGMEGYRDGMVSHIDGRPCSIMDPVATHYIIRPYMQSCIDQCPQIPFTFYGRPRFRLRGGNLTVICEAEPVAA